jgi:hypothetical protein
MVVKVPVLINALHLDADNLYLNPFRPSGYIICHQA